jgi:hypothetical protein
MYYEKMTYTFLAMPLTFTFYFMLDVLDASGFIQMAGMA